LLLHLIYKRLQSISRVTGQSSFVYPHLHVYVLSSNKMAVKIFLTCFALVAGLMQGSEAQYMCQYNLTYTRVWKTTPSTIQSDECSGLPQVRSCGGDMCQYYVQCFCTNSATGNNPPGAKCWTPGQKMTTAAGLCDSTVPIGTAVSKFINGKYQPTVCGAFMGCADTGDMLVYYQGCSQGLSIQRVAKGSALFPQMYVILLQNLVNPDLTNKFDCIEQPNTVPTCNLDTGLMTCKT